MLYKGLQNYEIFWYEKPVFGQKDKLLAKN